MNFRLVYLCILDKIFLTLKLKGGGIISSPVILFLISGCSNNYFQLILFYSSTTKAFFKKSLVSFPMRTSKAKANGLFFSILM